MDKLYYLFPLYLYIPVLLILGFFIGHFIAFISMFVFNFYIRKDKSFTLKIFAVLSLMFSFFTISILNDTFTKVDKGNTLYTQKEVVTLQSSRYVFNKGIIIVPEQFDNKKSYSVDIDVHNTTKNFNIEIKDLTTSQLNNIKNVINENQDEKISHKMTNNDINTYMNIRIKPLIEESITRMILPTENLSDYHIENLETIIKSNTGLTMKLNIK